MLFGPGTYLVPREDGLLVVGATSEPDAGFSEGLTPEGQKQLEAGIAALLPEASQWPPMERWRGFRPCTPDEGPLLGQAQWLGCGWPAATTATGSYWQPSQLSCWRESSGKNPSSSDSELLGAFAWNRFVRGISPQRANPDQRANHSARKAGTQTNFELSGFRSIGAMDHVAADVDSEITADRAGLSF